MTRIEQVHAITRSSYTLSHAKRSELAMDNPDFLYLLTSRLDNTTLERLSRTPLWNEIKLFASSQHYWYSRTQHLFESGYTITESMSSEKHVFLTEDLQPRPEAERACKQFGTNVWKRIYYLVLDALDWSNPLGSAEVLACKPAVEVLLEVGYNPATNGSHALLLASKLGYADVVKLLLEDGRADPAAENNYALDRAIRRVHTEVVRLLLEDGRADPTYNNNEAVFYAVALGYADIAKLLLADRRVNSTVNMDMLLSSARVHSNDKSTIQAVLEAREKKLQR